MRDAFGHNHAGIVPQKALLSDSSKKDSFRHDRSARNWGVRTSRDIAYNQMRAWQGALAVSDLRWRRSAGLHIVMRLREEQNARYFHLYRTPWHSRRKRSAGLYGIVGYVESPTGHFKMIYSRVRPAANGAPSCDSSTMRTGGWSGRSGRSGR